MCWTGSEPYLRVVEHCKTVRGAICNKKNLNVLEKDKNVQVEVQFKQDIHIYIYIIWQMKLHVVICMVSSLTFLSVGLYIMFKSLLDCIFTQWDKCSVFVSWGEHRKNNSRL